MKTEIIVTLIILGIVVTVALAVKGWMRSIYPEFNKIIENRTVYANCDFIKKAANPNFDYCESTFADDKQTYFCKCCWDRSYQYNFTLCKFYEVRKIGNMTEVWEAFPTAISH